jgi:hypothetical protein
MTLPNLIIAGVSKAGTTSLFAYLSQHPQVCPSRNKDTYYFTPLRDGAEPGPLQNYEALFSHCDGHPVVLEATPNYFYGGAALIQRMMATLPGVRVIVSLRNPVDRLWSSYHMKRRKGRIQSESFEEFVDRCLAADREEIETSRRYGTLATGRYAEHLPDWSEAFGSRLKVIFLEQWVKDPAAAVAEICDWMSLDTDVSQIDFRVRNPATLHRNRRLWRLAAGVNRRLHLVLVTRPGLKRSLTDLYRRLNAVQVTDRMPAEVRERLEQIYREPNERLRRQLLTMGHKDLPAWLDTGAPSHPERRETYPQSKDSSSRA